MSIWSVLEVAFGKICSSPFYIMISSALSNVASDSLTSEITCLSARILVGDSFMLSLTLLALFAISKIGFSKPPAPPSFGA